MVVGQGVRAIGRRLADDPDVAESREVVGELARSSWQRHCRSPWNQKHFPVEWCRGSIPFARARDDAFQSLGTPVLERKRSGIRRRSHRRDLGAPVAGWFPRFREQALLPVIPFRDRERCRSYAASQFAACIRWSRVGTKGTRRPGTGVGSPAGWRRRSRGAPGHHRRPGRCVLFAPLGRRAPYRERWQPSESSDLRLGESSDPIGPQVHYEE
jgi:hypothetical protein